VVCDPVQYLTNCGETDALSDQDIALDEKFEVRAWAEARSAQAFDLLRVENCTSATSAILALPATTNTSSVIEGHIHRAAFLA